MKVRINRRSHHPVYGALVPGDVLDVAEEDGERWISKGLASKTTAKAEAEKEEAKAEPKKAEQPKEEPAKAEGNYHSMISRSDIAGTTPTPTLRPHAKRK
jgi:hypothetical protein